MYCVNENYKESFYQSNILNFYFDDLNIGVIDIETTGLNPDRSHFILGGLLVPDSQEKKALQLFSDSKDEEDSLLRSYLSELKNLDVLISYNGDHFDLPFLNRRIKYNQISREELPMFQSFDLYRILDRYSTFRKLLPNLKQKTVEAFLGLWTDRADEISGAESVELYHQFLRTRDPAIRDIILLHNRDDILQLSRLMKVFEKLNLHKVMHHTGFIVSHKEKKVYIRKIQIHGHSILVTGFHRNIPVDYKGYQAGHEAAISSKSGDFTLRIPLKVTKGYAYVDLDEFLFDCSVFEKYPGYQSSYLLIKNDDEINYAEVNHLIKLILKEILESL